MPNKEKHLKQALSLYSPEEYKVPKSIKCSWKAKQEMGPCGGRVTYLNNKQFMCTRHHAIDLYMIDKDPMRSKARNDAALKEVQDAKDMRRKMELGEFDDTIARMGPRDLSGENSPKLIDTSKKDIEIVESKIIKPND